MKQIARPLRLATLCLLAIGAISAHAATAVPIANQDFDGGFTSGNASSGTGIWVKPADWDLITPGG